jgi:hypothetical protein
MASRALAPTTEREEGDTMLGDDLRGKRGGGEWRAEVGGVRSAAAQQAHLGHGGGGRGEVRCPVASVVLNHRRRAPR